MHNLWVRLNAVIFFGLTVLLGMAWMCAFSTYLHNGEPVVKKLKLHELKSLKTHGGMDRALLTIDLEADLTPAFHWNLKQLFVFVVAEYRTKKNVLNQVILWDDIIQEKSKAIIKLKNKMVKYALIDQGRELRDNEIQLKLMWDHMPLTGGLYNAARNASKFKLPEEYTMTS